jgi:hypothetical protein
MTDIDSIVNNYLAAWNTLESESRVILLGKIIAEDCLYADAHLPETISTRESHCQFIDRFRDKFPHLKIELSSPPNAHHRFFRFGWQLVTPDSQIFAKGSFFGEIDRAGKINKLIGFVD